MEKTITIKKAFAQDHQFKLEDGAGSDAIHSTPIYAYAVCKLQTDQHIEGIGLAFTLGTGNNLVCSAINYLIKYIEGKEINELMSDYGKVFKKMADDPNFRWLGPHKGVVHLAIASITNACFDLWAKSKDLPLWKLLIDLPAESLVDTLDFSYLEDEMTRVEAIETLHTYKQTQNKRLNILNTGYRGYDTSIGWFNYSDQKIIEKIKKSMDQGFTAMKLKVGSNNFARDIRRAELVRKNAGDTATIMLDANQQWSLPKAIQICKELMNMNPFWIEEPTHPDDVRAHISLAREIPNIKLALGEHVPNKVVFKNYLQSACMAFNQVDAVRVGGVSEFITISLLSKKFGIPIVPHVGDMGQIHQHLVLFNHISLDHSPIFLEYIPHLKEHFKYPAEIKNGYYKVPTVPGMSSDLKTRTT